LLVDREIAAQSELPGRVLEASVAVIWAGQAKIEPW
jgi:hypothetical protein